jgi:hypothetical protein
MEGVLQQPAQPMQWGSMWFACRTAVDGVWRRVFLPVAAGVADECCSTPVELSCSTASAGGRPGRLCLALPVASMRRIAVLRCDTSQVSPLVMGTGSVPIIVLFY